MSGNEAAPAIEVRELTKRYGRFVAVDRVSFEVQAGEVFGFLGPNGAGKTTTIKMLAGLVAPSGGSARVASRDVRRETEAVKRSIGYMSQLFSLYPDLTVGENIALFSGLYGVPHDRRARRRDWVISMAGLEGKEGRRTGDLPLGWKQRLALGCAMLHEPPVLFLDEPTSGVDPISRRSFWDRIYEMAGRGTTVLVSTHYMEEAEYCHRLALMNRGRLVAVDSPRSLREGMREPILSLRTSNSAAAIEAVQGLEGVLEAGMFGRAVHVIVAPGETPRLRGRITEALAAARVELQAVDEVEPSLEDLFIARIRAAERT
ncbi:MAG: ATP-binding cassette domain-containing protein [Candidatus Eisenbacteria bacterium]